MAVLRWLRHGAEGVAAAMLAALFLTFVLQIFARYVLVQPIGWTIEICLMLWVWLVFWGNAFVVRERDHVTFDLLYLAAPARLRRIMALVSAAAIAVGLAVSLLPTWDYIDFLRIKRSSVLRIPMRDVFSIYAVFLIATVLAYAWRFWHVARHGLPDEGHHHLRVTDE